LNSAHDAVLAGSRKDGINLAFVIYDWRHTFATRVAQAGIDLATLAAILGHSSIRIVQKYVHRIRPQNISERRCCATRKVSERSPREVGGSSEKLLSPFCPPFSTNDKNVRYPEQRNGASI
jgi:hypothetical protein